MTIQNDIEQALQALLADPRMRCALAYLRDNAAARIAEIREMCLLHGASFREAELRSPMFRDKLASYGAADSTMDAHDNAFAFIHGEDPALVLLEAHLDTVFPVDTPLEIQEDGTRISCPGVGDDTAGLGAVLSIARAIRSAGLRPVRSICLAGTSGEEGEGDLRGIKGFLRDHPETAAHLALEPHEFGHVTKDAVGSRRYEVIFRGPGGHSFQAFGLPSPLHALGRAIAKMANIRTPKDPKTTYTVGLVSGGTSVNSIAFEGRMKIDLRSVSQEELDKLETEVLNYMREAAEEETAFWAASGQRISLELLKIGDRAAGSQAQDAPIVQAALAATSAIGGAPRITAPSSTNSNAAIGAGIPSLVIRTGGATGNTHNLAEWFDTAGSELGDAGALLLLFLLSGLQGVTEPLVLL